MRNLGRWLTWLAVSSLVSHLCPNKKNIGVSISHSDSKVVFCIACNTSNGSLIFYYSFHSNSNFTVGHGTLIGRYFGAATDPWMVACAAGVARCVTWSWWRGMAGAAAAMTTSLDTPWKYGCIGFQKLNIYMIWNFHGTSNLPRFAELVRLSRDDPSSRWCGLTGTARISWWVGEA